MGMLLRLRAFGDLLQRYKMVIAYAWKHRKEMDSPPRLSHEAQFLPAALALQETPVSPAPRVIMWLLIAFAAITLLWAFFGHVDVVATAQGKIVPNERVKTIQPFETSTVRAIHVTDGQNVKAGDLLIELDSTATAADMARLENDLIVARLQAARSGAFLRAMDGGDPVLSDLPDIPVDRSREEQRLLEGQWHEYKAKLDRTEAEVTRVEAELRSTKEVVNTLERTVPIARDRAEVFKKLYEQDVASKQDYLEREKTLIEQEGQLASQTEKLRESQAALDGVKKQKASLIAETRRTMMDTQREADQKVTANSQELIKAQQRHKQMKLLAPVEGSVQQLAIHTIGGVVTPAQQLMIIVPKDDALEVEAFLENKDIGFVTPGQDAEVKIETFTYTKYGTIHAEVKHVSSDAIQDEKRGLIYSTRVKLGRSTVHVGKNVVNLSPGMAVTVEIKTDKRRVIEYFLTPLIQHANESLRER
ncbi:HlyD family type I secretion periplasmic adaptor subunit [Desulfomonile tiedjei]|uniref:Type I secretion membrane fusion protein, HlyD family n=1 Tax=Desulfomonile tiedjei (strain ATCC 49306 / DSM 6799 / DCB-1) TaxID=706587 RepID=I4C998_DESTA|nr:HlyD family type I secretion periplasmic adaptor subunit [Desulfomonile tiedjei]AFM26139.1 type I secretion membrane fusion protein, HlyD family [Desulfomonile tiedjei DSM 6799]